jgi:hypothetical protein
VSVLGFSVTEHHPDRPWIVLKTTHHTAELDHGTEFFS